MCIICIVGQKTALESTRVIASVTQDAVTFPFATEKSKQRLKHAMAEMILAVNESYGIEIRDGITEDDARKEFEATLDKAVEEKTKEFDRLAKLFGIQGVSLEDAMKKVRDEHGDIDVLKEEFIN